jgi:peptidyl-tRNA hydrolase, PTH1 family
MAEEQRRKLIVGLGNPGRQYAGNRHNIGFRVADALAAQYHLKFDKMMNKGIVALGEIETSVGVCKVALVKPQTFMNDSGQCVGPLLKFYKSTPRDLLVIYDELDLPAAKVQLRKAGGAGGHNGMRSIIQHLGTQEFARMRMGIGRPPGQMQPKDFVLRDFSAGELAELGFAMDKAIGGVKFWLTETIDNAMNRVNVPE